jgi:hypothetical protein
MPRSPSANSMRRFPPAGAGEPVGSASRVLMDAATDIARDVSHIASSPSSRGTLNPGRQILALRLLQLAVAGSEDIEAGRASEGRPRST